MVWVVALWKTTLSMAGREEQRGGTWQYSPTCHGASGWGERSGTPLTVGVCSSHCKCIASSRKRAPSLAKEGAGPSKSCSPASSRRFWHGGLPLHHMTPFILHTTGTCCSVRSNNWILAVTGAPVVALHYCGSTSHSQVAYYMVPACTCNRICD